MKKTAKQEIIRQISNNGGVIRTADALRLGIQSRALYALRDQGDLVQIERGLFRLRDLPPLSHPDWVIVAAKIPRAVICLVSALAFHNLTTEIAHEVYIALPKSMQKPRVAYPPIRYFWFSQASYEMGIEYHHIDNINIPIYSKAKTVADCFKFRNKIGLDISIAALKQYMDGTSDLSELLVFATSNRVVRVMQPYIEALL